MYMFIVWIAINISSGKQQLERSNDKSEGYWYACMLKLINENKAINNNTFFREKKREKPRIKWYPFLETWRAETTNTYSSDIFIIKIKNKIIIIIIIRN
jgi:hypothetical protein